MLCCGFKCLWVGVFWSVSEEWKVSYDGWILIGRVQISTTPVLTPRRRVVDRCEPGIIKKINREAESSVLRLRWGMWVGLGRRAWRCAADDDGPLRGR